MPKRRINAAVADAKQLRATRPPQLPDVTA
jgi:hypothetical protein